MFGLAILMSLIITSHNIFHIERDYAVLFRNIVCILFVYYSFLQLNFSLISHNFGIRQGDLVDFRVTYMLVFVMFSVYVKLSSAHKTKLKSIAPDDHGALRKTLLIFVLLVALSYVTTLELWASLW
jgi:glucan phosphoethanolaminetransferase (alkaline phosphatase superfamily)